MAIEVFGSPNSNRRPYPKPTRKAPTLATMIRWSEQGGCKATDGCTVEDDGVCCHGHPSWLLRLGFV